MYIMIALLEPCVAHKMPKPVLKPIHLHGASARWLNPAAPLCVLRDFFLCHFKVEKIYKISLWNEGKKKKGGNTGGENQVDYNVRSLQLQLHWYYMSGAGGLQREAGSDRWCRFQGIMLTPAAGINNLKEEGNDPFLPCPLLHIRLFPPYFLLWPPVSQKFLFLSSARSRGWGEAQRSAGYIRIDSYDEAVDDFILNC